MKRALLIFSSLVALISNTAQGQNMQPVVYKVSNVESLEPQSRSANKTTGPGGARWYNHFDVVNTYTSNTLSQNSFVFPIWFDSTVKQRYSGGANPVYNTVKWSSMYQVIDPTSELFNDTALVGNVPFEIKKYNTYSIDSIRIVGAYVRVPNRPFSVIDTLIFSIVPIGDVTDYTFLEKKDHPNEVPKYTTSDTLWSVRPYHVDSLNRTAISTSLPSWRKHWKVLLNATQGDTLGPNGFKIQEFSYGTGGGIQIPAGRKFAITATFKSGDTWTKNVDSIEMYNRFMPLTSELIPDTTMPNYRLLPKNGVPLNDWSMSGMMHANDSTKYIPSIFLDVYDKGAFKQEFHAISAYITCKNCPSSIENVSGVISNLEAYPNPANDVLNLSFSMRNRGDARVVLANLTGSTISSTSYQNVDKVNATLDISDLADGIYIYTIYVEGEKLTGKVSIIH